MRSKILVGLMLVLCQGLSAETLTDEKKALIDELLSITGAIKIGHMMGEAVAQQMISQVINQKGSIDPKIEAVIRDEISQIMHEQFVANRFVNEMSYEIYHNHLTLAEIRELVAFYKTPVGTKVIAVLPQITQEGMEAGRKHGETLGPIIRERLTRRLERERQ